MTNTIDVSQIRTIVEMTTWTRIFGAEQLVNVRNEFVEIANQSEAHNEEVKKSIQTEIEVMEGISENGSPHRKFLADEALYNLKFVKFYVELSEDHKGEEILLGFVQRVVLAPHIDGGNQRVKSYLLDLVLSEKRDEMKLKDGEEVVADKLYSAKDVEEAMRELTEGMSGEISMDYLMK